MEYQFVFGNPIGGIAKKKNASKMKRKGNSGVKKKKKVHSRKTAAKRKNPYVWSGISAKGRRTKGRKRWFTNDELTKMLDRLQKAQRQLDAGPNKPKTTKTLTKRIATLENWIKSQNFRIADAEKEKEKFQKKGLNIEPFEVQYLQGSTKKKSKGKKKVAARKKAKKKVSKKKVSKKKSPFPKGYQAWPKKGIKSGTKKVKKLRKKKTIKYAVGKGKKQRRYSLRRNPMGLALPRSMSQVESYVGNLGELTSLTLGGLSYGMVQQYALKFFPGIYKFAEKIPVVGPIVGPAFPTLVVGILCHKVGDMKNIQPLKMVGKGLLGASVVGMAMSAAKQIMPMSGIPEGLGESADFEGVEAFSGIPEGLGYEQVSLGQSADFEGVEAFSGADFEGVEAFSGIPEGLGYGQLG